MNIDFYDYKYIRYSYSVEIKKQIYSYIRDFYGEYSNIKICKNYQIFIEIEAKNYKKANIHKVIASSCIFYIIFRF